MNDKTCTSLGTYFGIVPQAWEFNGWCLAMSLSFADFGAWILLKIHPSSLVNLVAAGHLDVD